MGTLASQLRRLPLDLGQLLKEAGDIPLPSTGDVTLKVTIEAKADLPFIPDALDPYAKGTITMHVGLGKNPTVSFEDGTIAEFLRRFAHPQEK